jgi:heat shock protein HslJ
MRRVFVTMSLWVLAGMPAVAADLAGSEWRPTTIGQAAWTGGEAFVRFEGEGRLTGHAGCNGFFGTYRVDEGTLEIGPLASTRKACPEPVMTAETHLMHALESARGFVRDGTSLTLTGQDGELASFVQTDWD